MKFDSPNKPARRLQQRISTRMQGYDYSLAGAYFITLVTYQREMLFGEVVNDEMKLSRRGEIVQEEWFASVGMRKEIRLFPEEFVVMPNHIHGIVWIVEDEQPKLTTGDATIVGANNVEANDIWSNSVVGANGRSPLRAPSRPHMKPRSLSSFVAGFKASVTKRIRDELNETCIWQRNYHDHIIRSKRELDAIRKYIEANPRNWSEDNENPLVEKQ